MKSRRIDELLVERDMVAGLKEAQARILAGVSSEKGSIKSVHESIHLCQSGLSGGKGVHLFPVAGKTRDHLQKELSECHCRPV